MKTIDIVKNCKKIPDGRNTLMKTKILTEFQVHILSFSHFTAIQAFATCTVFDSEIIIL